MKTSRHCPGCGEPMRLESRGDDTVALYCAGPNGYDGCVFAFGEDEVSAAAEVERIALLKSGKGQLTLDL